MAMTREEACRVLELHRDATGEEIRASYKRLALRWHPDKHNNSPDSTKKFQEISSAYKRLTSNESSDDIHLTRADMFDIFAHVFFHRNGMFDFNRYNPSESDEDYSDDEEDDMEDELLHSIATRLRNKYDRSKTTNCTKANEKPAHHLSESEALRNAEELIEEEEKERKKAEKRRQKKKRSKEKRRQKEKKDEKENEKDNKKENDKEKTNIQFEKQRLKENQNMSNKPQNVKISKSNHSSSTPGVKEKTQNTSNSNKKDHQKSNDNKKNHVNGDSDSDEEEPDWDQSSAFFARAAGRNPPPDPSNSTLNTLKETSKSNTASSSNTADTHSNKNNEKEAASEQLDPVVLQSRQLAVRGNEMANLSNYPAAIELFTQAIKLDARDFRFFGNRSYCYDRLGQYEKALQDADVAISLAPDWPKGYFRRGRALAGIKLFSDSEVAFAQVLKLDKQCEDAIFELTRVRVQQLEDMGFPTSQSEAAINSFGTVQAALEALLAGKVICNTEEIYVSDGEEVEDTRVSQNLAPVLQTLGSCKSVWVGNVNAEVVSEEELQKIFSQCGKIESVKVLPTRYCAFINYSTPEAAARAISVLQAFELGGQNLLLRYPNNSGVPTSLQPQTNESFCKPKLTGPVNGDECYFWRTTGCSFGDRCRNKHTPESKGIDLKKVEAKYGGKF